MSDGLKEIADKWII